MIDIKIGDKYDWAIKNGYREGLALDRKNNNKGYSPTNCRWVTTKENCNNTRSNIMIIWEGELVTLTNLCSSMSLNYVAVYTRIKRGWSHERAIKTPVRDYNKKLISDGEY